MFVKLLCISVFVLLSIEPGEGKHEDDKREDEKDEKKESGDVREETKAPTSDPKTEIHKLFSNLKAARRESAKATKPHPWKDSSSKGMRISFASTTTASHPMQEVVVDILKQLDAWKILHSFCMHLPIFGKLSEDKVYLSVCVFEGSTGEQLETLIERYNVHVYI